MDVPLFIFDILFLQIYIPGPISVLLWKAVVVCWLTPNVSPTSLALNTRHCRRCLCLRCQCLVYWTVFASCEGEQRSEDSQERRLPFCCKMIMKW